jgi:hypothetical protein
MKLKSKLPIRRNGEPVKAFSYGKAVYQIIDGICEVPDEIAERLINTGNFEAAGKPVGGVGGKVEAGPQVVLAGAVVAGKDKDGDGVIELEEMSKNGLLAIAADMGIEINASAKKEAIIMAIRKVEIERGA